MPPEKSARITHAAVPQTKANRSEKRLASFILPNFPAGSYSLKVAGVLRKTFFLIAGTKLDLSID